MLLRSTLIYLSFLPLSCSLLANANDRDVILGKLLFNDTNLSQPAGQSCNSCHGAESFRANPDQVVSPGANPQLFGNRNAPAIGYTKFNPELYWDAEEAHWVGGFFLDGRAKTLEEQAGGPFLNPLEMGNTSKADVVAKVRQSDYSTLFEQQYGRQIWDDVEQAFDAITRAIAAYERGPEFGLFSSKYDHYLQGRAQLTELEKQGLELFEAEDKGNCAACHPSQMGENGELPLLTDFTYDNLGLPPFPQLPFNGMATEYNPDGAGYIDLGLHMNGHINNAAEEKGKFKVPTLRNVAKTGPYMHNGLLATLEEVVDFYNSRDVKEKWGKPEVMDNLNTDELGDLKLSDQEIKALVAFMNTLTDGYSQ